jgi:pyruvate dehydrogenase complex dehydrogenase (E1) component
VRGADRLLRLHVDATQHGTSSSLDARFPTAARTTPAMPLLDGPPLTRAWLGALVHTPLIPLGVVHGGETGVLQPLYHKHHIDTDAVLTAMGRLLCGQRQL